MGTTVYVISAFFECREKSSVEVLFLGGPAEGIIVGRAGTEVTEALKSTDTLW